MWARVLGEHARLADADVAPLVADTGWVRFEDGATRVVVFALGTRIVILELNRSAGSLRLDGLLKPPPADGSSVTARSGAESVAATLAGRFVFSNLEPGAFSLHAVGWGDGPGLTTEWTTL